VSDSHDWPPPGSDQQDWPPDNEPSSFEPAIEPSDHRRRSLESRVDIPQPGSTSQASPPAEQAAQANLLPERMPPMSLSPPPKRVRVVLAERKRARRVVRTLAEVEEQTDVGEMLVRNLIRSQLGTSLLLALIVVAALGAIPLAFAYVPKLAELSVLGVRLPWLLLGFAVYPFMLGIGWIYVRQADRNEQNFIKFVEE
jgi:hypothetical protein